VKHIDVRHHAIRELIAEKKLTFAWVRGRDNRADGLTKPLVPILHNKMLGFLNVRAREDVGV